MSHPILDKYRDLKPLNDDDSVNKMMKIIIDIPRPALEKFVGKSKTSGTFYLYENDAFPNKVLEYVPGYSGDDSVTTLYEGHRVFQSRQALIDAREEIITAINQLLLAIDGTVVVHDSGRERQAYLAELGTAQLIDVLTHFSYSAPNTGGIIRLN